MLIRLLKAIVELIVVSAKLAYVFVFYPKSTPTKKAKKVLDPEYNPTEYGSGETVAALKDKWLHDNMNEVEEAEWRQKYMSDVHDFSEVDDYTSDPMVVGPTKKILADS